jgi:4-hydroxy-tetrahydrodipicolinate synthase
MQKKLTGLGPALVTPFREDGTIDFQGLERLLHFTGPHVDYFVVLGTTGEAPTLSFEERQLVFDFVADNNPWNHPLVIGIGGINTAEVVMQLRQMNLEKADAVLSVCPYYVKPTTQGLFQHFTTVADASPKPVLLYNVPGRTASNLSAETTLQLAWHPNIIGIKEASGDFEQILKIAAGKPKEFLLISGDDLLTPAMMSMGAVGVISVIANAFPEAFAKVVKQAGAGHFKASRENLFSLLTINSLMYKEGNPAGVKAALNLLNICKSNTRLPLAAASSALMAELEEAMSKLPVEYVMHEGV